MTDRVFAGWLTRQCEEGLALAAASDLLSLLPLEALLSQRYLAEYRCTGLVKTATGEIAEANRFAVGIWFPDEYLRVADTFQVLTWLEPRQAFHPNISARAPFICIGPLAPGTPLVDILYRCHEVITFNRLTMVESNALNLEACAWARRNQQRFPVDRRPLKRRSVEFDVQEIEVSP